MSALRGVFPVMVLDFIFHEIVGGTDPGGYYGMVCAFLPYRWKNSARMQMWDGTFLCSYTWGLFFWNSICMFLYAGTALDCAGGRKPDDSDFVYGSGTAGKCALEKTVRAVWL